MQTMYEAHGLKKWYGGKPALNGVEFAVQPGRLVGLLGPNGAGKTTLLKISAVPFFQPAGFIHRLHVVPPSIRSRFPLRSFPAPAAG